MRVEPLTAAAVVHVAARLSRGTAEEQELFGRGPAEAAARAMQRVGQRMAYAIVDGEPVAVCGATRNEDTVSLWLMTADGLARKPLAAVRIFRRILADLAHANPDCGFLIFTSRSDASARQFIRLLGFDEGGPFFGHWMHAWRPGSLHNSNEL